jgi:uncharacterized protein
MLKTHPKSISLFLILTFTVSWSLAAAFVYLGFSYKGTSAVILGMIYMLIPMIATFFLQIFYNKEPVSLLEIRFRMGKWFFTALLIFPLISLLSIGTAVLMPGIEYSPEMEYMLNRFRTNMSNSDFIKFSDTVTAAPVHMLFITLLQSLVAGLTINALFAFGEELGWRGYLHNHLIHLGFWKTSLITGMIWGIWHAPIILQGHNYPDHPQSGVFMMTLWCMLLAPLFTLLRIKTRSVISAAVAHGTLNGSAGLSFLFLKGGSDLTNGITGLAGFIVIILLNILIFLYLKYNPLQEGFIPQDKSAGG